ncbi:hypothetical protein PF002_g31020 [Phytophthora fragariae]|uniref:Transposase MuDR plant domain-containing protein n=1 Tax=Phytophthora fragariae TaxID=53985 RepID=A0A6A3VJG9_9STRA|nr:hypothetical protein PF002_g31020 [Phytophthora fragariae]
MSGAEHVVCGDTSSGGRLDLWLLHGRESISIHDIFPTTTACTKFLKDYACNQNKSIKQKSNGFLKKWMCKGVGCTWCVWITQKRPSVAKTQGGVGSTKTTKFGHVPVFAWYVSKLDLLHTQLCDAVAEPTAV